MRHILERLAVACALGALAAGATAQPRNDAAPGARAISGGIGEQEAQALRRQAADHSVALTFTSQRGEYLADVDVVVRDRFGDTVLRQRSDGPIMLIDLPPGAYTLEASYGGHTLSRPLAVRADAHRALVLRWDTPRDVLTPAAAAPLDRARSGSDGAPGTTADGREAAPRPSDVARDADDAARRRTDALRAMSAGEAGALVTPRAAPDRAGSIPAGASTADPALARHPAIGASSAAASSAEAASDGASSVDASRGAAGASSTPSAPAAPAAPVRGRTIIVIPR